MSVFGETVAGKPVWVILPPRVARVHPRHVDLPTTGQRIVRARFDAPARIGNLHFSELYLDADNFGPSRAFRRDRFASHLCWVVAATLSQTGPVRLPLRARWVRAAPGYVRFTDGGSAESFVPAESFRWAPFRFAEGHRVDLGWTWRGVLAEAITLGGVALDAGTYVETDPGNDQALMIKAALPMKVFGHEVAAGSVVWVQLGRTPSPATVVVGGSRKTIRPGGSVE